jgi:hypothetical protein
VTCTRNSVAALDLDLGSPRLTSTPGRHGTDFAAASRMPESRFLSHASGPPAAREIMVTGSWHLRPAHQTTSYDKVSLRPRSCRQIEHSSALASMTAVATNDIRPHSFCISSRRTTSFLQPDLRGDLRQCEHVRQLVRGVSTRDI